MDLIYTNAARVEQGVLQAFELDMAFGADENDFECTVTARNHVCENGSLLYFEGTEYGGMVDSIESNTASEDVTYSGRTWHGILNSKVLEPDSGKDYLVLNGEANAVLASLIQRMGLTDLFSASDEDSGMTISSYKMNRYITGYDGIVKMLESVGGKLKIRFEDGAAVLSAQPIKDYTQDEEFDSDLVPFTAKRNYKTINHLVCLGSGELASRLVVHLYADAVGNISETQTFTGLDEITSIYEYSQISEESELISEGTAKFKELLASDEIEIDFDADTDEYDVGDIIGAVDNVTGLSAHSAIKKKVVAVKNGQISISLEPDTAKSGSTQESSSGGGSGGGGDTVGTMPNLLDNWYFVNPVNQREVKSVPGYDSAQPYFIDRWRRAGYTAATLTLSEGVTFDNSAVTAGGSGIMQILENVLPSGTYTLSVYLAECNGSCWISVNNSANTVIQSAIFTEAGVYSMTVTSNSIKQVRLLARAGSTVKVLAVKLECGDTQTLAHQDANGNWQLNELPNYGKEMQNCKRYYQQFVTIDDYALPIGYGSMTSTTGARLAMTLQAPMRAIPTLTATNVTFSLRSGSTNTVLAAKPTIFSLIGNILTLAAVSPSAMSATYAPALLTYSGTIGKTHYLELSAEL